MIRLNIDEESFRKFIYDEKIICHRYFRKFIYDEKLSCYRDETDVEFRDRCRYLKHLEELNNDK